MAYIVSLSDKSKVQIDTDELESVIRAINSGGVVRVRRGIFNPVYFVSITEDSKRIEEFRNSLPQGIYDGPTRVLTPLKDVFTTLPSTEVPKRLPDSR